MSNNLKELREASMLSPKELSILLNVTVHTYIAMEQDKFSVAPEIKVMLSKIYGIPQEYLLDGLSIKCKEVEDALNKLSICSENERFSLALTNLIGKIEDKHISKKIRKLKINIIRNIQ